MSQTSPQFKPGDVVNGHVLTDQGQWVPVGGPVPTAPVKKRHTVRNIFLALLAVGVLLIGGCMALIGGAANELDKAIEKSEAEDAQPGGPDNPLEITVGEPFEVSGFAYAAGWKVVDDFGTAIEGLKVTNNRDEADSAIVEVKFWKGTEVLALVDCTSESVAVGTTTTLSCLSGDALPQDYDKVTINDTF